jgi:hypothetical protein
VRLGLLAWHEFLLCLRSHDGDPIFYEFYRHEVAHGFGRCHDNVTDVCRYLVPMMILWYEVMHYVPPPQNAPLEGLAMCKLLDSCIIQHLYSMFKSHICQEIDKISLYILC